MSENTLQLVYAAIDEINAQSSDGSVIQKTPDVSLLGGKQGVDSLTFVNLIVALEEQIQNSTGQSVLLVDEESMAMQDHPFRTVGSLASYVEKLLGNATSH